MSRNRLKTYKEKRDFKTSPEPEGKIAKTSGEPIFVIHKHDARSLHYDLRLEDNGVLKSWAIPKGPSDNPHDKRLAIQTEDHPYDYADFEGIIPEGNYGAGGVQIWDKGTYKNLKPRSLDECIQRGVIEIEFHGEKMHGRYALVHTGFSENSWLFFKMKENVTPYDHILEQDRSVISGKTIEEIEEEGRELLLHDHIGFNGMENLVSTTNTKKKKPEHNSALAKAKPTRVTKKRSPSKKESKPAARKKRAVTKTSATKKKSRIEKHKPMTIRKQTAKKISEPKKKLPAEK